MLYLRTMGALSLHQEDSDGAVLIGNSRCLVLLAWLSVAPGRRASREYLSSLLWPAAERKARLRSLRQCLYSLARDGADSCFETTDGSVALRPDELRTDVDDFRSALEAHDYEKAIRLAGDQFLESVRGSVGHELSHWIDAENERIRIGLRLACTEAVDGRLTDGDPGRAVELAREYARREPLSEHAHVLLVQALRVAGNDPAALAAYEAYRSLLRDEVGDRPGPELEASAARVREELLRTPAHPVPDLLSRETGRGPRRRKGSSIALGVLGVAAALTLGWAARGTYLRPPADPWFSGLSVRLPVRVSSSDSTVWLVVESGRVRATHPTDPAGRFDHESIPSPDGRYIARPFETPRGYDLRLVDRATGELRTLLATPADEKPLDWSPDGRYLAFGFGLGVGDGSGYWHGIGAYDVLADSIVFLQASGIESDNTHARWSPDGTRIAYLAGPDSARDIAVMDADGEHLRGVTRRGHVVGWPEWSPDARRLLFASDGEGPRDLHTVRSNGTGLSRLTDLGGVYMVYAWVTLDAAIFFQGPASAARAWAVNPASADVRPLDSPNGETYSHVFSNWLSFERPDWIESVRIDGIRGELLTGERVRLRLEGSAADGEAIPVAGSVVRWSVSDTLVARLAADTLVALSEGTARVSGSAGGWRSDTLTVSVAELALADLDPVFDEDWSGGIDTAIWVPTGDPRPYTSTTGGPESAGVFVSNGDRNYLSGVVSRRAFPLAGGLTVEVWGRLPFNGDHWRSYVVRLLDPADARRRQEASDARIADALDAYAVGIDFNSYGSASLLRNRDGEFTLPWPDPPDRWRLYTLQVEPDGTSSVLYGDSLVARAPHFADVPPSDSVLVSIGGNSWHARVEHGVLRVYDGLRYRPP